MVKVFSYSWNSKHCSLHNRQSFYFIPLKNNLQLTGGKGPRMHRWRYQGVRKTKKIVNHCLKWLECSISVCKRKNKKIFLTPSTSFIYTSSRSRRCLFYYFNLLFLSKRWMAKQVNLLKSAYCLASTATTSHPRFVYLFLVSLVLQSLSNACTYIYIHVSHSSSQSSLCVCMCCPADVTLFTFVTHYTYSLRSFQIPPTTLPSKTNYFIKFKFQPWCF